MPMLKLASPFLVALLLFAASAAAQTPNINPHPPGQHYSPNIRLMSHVPLGGPMTVTDIEIEQELSRPYVYVSRMGVQGFDIVDIKDPQNAKVIYRWSLENAALHRGNGAMDGKYFKLNGRYYYIQSFQLQGGGPNHDLGAVVFDVTGLPDVRKIREVGRIHVPDLPGGFHNIFTYRHSNGKVYLFATVESPVEDDRGAHVYDMELFLKGAPDNGLVSYIPLPEPRGAARGYHDAYVAYDPATGQDKFYGGGPETTYEGGSFIWDVSDVTQPRLIGSLRAVHSQQSGGHTFVATPDHRYVMTVMTSLAHQPIRFFDLKPILDGEREVINEPIGAWTPDWRKSVHMIEVRWPYAFVASYQDGLQVLYIRDPSNPFPIAFYDTYPVPEEYVGGGTARGAFGLDVRNADGLIVVADMFSGFWAFRLDEFAGWHGHDWGVPNSSSAQDWDNGPDLVGHRAR